MDPAYWAKAHGAATHFPFALTLVSGVLDVAGFALAGRPVVRDLHAAGYWTIVLGAIGAVPAVVSGLLMTRGSLLGHGPRSHCSWRSRPGGCPPVGVRPARRSAGTCWRSWSRPD
jgi:hypothetical protein